MMEKKKSIQIFKLLCLGDDSALSLQFVQQESAGALTKQLV